MEVGVSDYEQRATVLLLMTFLVHISRHDNDGSLYRPSMRLASKLVDSSAEEALELMMEDDSQRVMRAAVDHWRHTLGHGDTYEDSKNQSFSDAVNRCLKRWSCDPEFPNGRV